MVLDVWTAFVYKTCMHPASSPAPVVCTGISMETVDADGLVVPAPPPCPCPRHVYVERPISLAFYKAQNPGK